TGNAFQRIRNQFQEIADKPMIEIPQVISIRSKPVDYVLTKILVNSAHPQTQQQFQDLRVGIWRWIGGEADREQAFQVRSGRSPGRRNREITELSSNLALERFLYVADCSL